MLCGKNRVEAMSKEVYLIMSCVMLWLFIAHQLVKIWTAEDEWGGKK